MSTRCHSCGAAATHSDVHGDLCDRCWTSVKALVARICGRSKS